MLHTFENTPMDVCFHLCFSKTHVNLCNTHVLHTAFFCCAGHKESKCGRRLAGAGKDAQAVRFRTGLVGGTAGVKRASSQPPARCTATSRSRPRTRRSSTRSSRPSRQHRLATERRVGFYEPGLGQQCWQQCCTECAHGHGEEGRHDQSP